MKIYPKEDIKRFNQIMWFKDKSYECSQIEENYDLWLVSCEPITVWSAGEYPLLEMHEILSQFYTIEDIRDVLISDVLK